MNRIFVPLGLIIMLFMQNVFAYDNGIEIRTPTPGVVVYLDGVEKGVTEPIINFYILRIKDITPGKHNIKCFHPDYEAYYSEIDVPSDKFVVHEVTFAAGQIKVEQLESTGGAQIIKVGSIIVKSNPSKAYVRLDNSTKGETDLVFHDVPIGKHKVEVYFDRTKLDQYLSIDISVASDESITVIADFLEKSIYTDKKYTLYITSKPKGTVYINDDKIGGVPFDKKLSHGKYSVRIERKDYLPYEELVDLYQNVFINAELKRIPTYANLKIEKDDYLRKENILIDDKYIGRTPYTTKIPVGGHSITIGDKTNVYDFEKDHSYLIIPKNKIPLNKSAEKLQGYEYPLSSPALLPTTMQKVNVDTYNVVRESALFGCLVGSVLGLVVGVINDEPILGTMGGAVTTTLIMGIINYFDSSYRKVYTTQDSKNIEINNKRMQEWDRKKSEVNERNDSLLEAENQEIETLNHDRGSWEFIDEGIM